MTKSSSKIPFNHKSFHKEFAKGFPQPSRLTKDSISSQKFMPPKSIAIGQDDNHYCQQDIYQDHLEHLEDLELEAKLMLAALLFRVSVAGSINSRIEMNIGLLELKRNVNQLSDVELWQAELQIDIEQREKRCQKLGIKLPFVTLCQRYQLDPTARRILLLVIVANTSSAFQAGWKNCFEDSTIEAGQLLSLLSSEFRSRLANRCYLSLDSPLLANNLVKLERYRSDKFDDWDVELEQWVIPYVLNDQNNYDTSNLCISKLNPRVTCEKLILPEDIKEKVFTYVNNYSKTREKRQKIGLSDYSDYGNGLVLLFHGPSGTGKTMLSHALANQLQRPLYCLDIGILEESDLSFEEGIKSLFRQAQLGQGIAFIDECDDILEDGHSDSRSMLIEMEKAECIIIMATNRPIELDPAFDRRITLKVPFSLPDKAQREALWRSMIPTAVELASDVNFEVLASRFALNGGLIKNAMQIAVNDALRKETNDSPLIQWPILLEAASEQAQSLFDSGLTYRPSTSISSLAVSQQDRQRLKKLVSVNTLLSSQGLGFSSILSVSDIDTGIACVDAIAAERETTIRSFSLVDILFPAIDHKYLDPVTQKEISGIQYVFGTKTGEDNILVFVDRCGLWNNLQNAEKSEDNHKISSEFLERVRCYNGSLILVTDAKISDIPPIQFSYSFSLGHPDKNTQIACWSKYFNNIDAEKLEIKQLVEEHPLFIREIDSVGKQVKTMGLINMGTSTVNMADIRLRISRMRGLRFQPKLFGQRT